MKLGQLVLGQEMGEVAPRAGAWIETVIRRRRRRLSVSRPPRGGVD